MHYEPDEKAPPERGRSMQNDPYHPPGSRHRSPTTEESV
jgi:hypothetical protein